MRKFFYLRNVVAIATCLAVTIAVTIFVSCDKENDLDKGFGFIKYDGVTYYLREDPGFRGRQQSCLAHSDGPTPSQYYPWWIQSYSVYAAKDKRGNYLRLDFAVMNSDFLAPMGTFSNVIRTRHSLESNGQYYNSFNFDIDYCREDIETGVMYDPCFSIDQDTDGTLLPITFLTSGNVEVKQTSKGCEVKGSFTATNGKKVEFDYWGTLKQ